MKMEKKTPLNILICDDDPGFHKLVQSYLRSADDNFVLEEAGRKGEIQNALDKGEIDLILLDILMPDKSGIDWLTEIVEREIAPVIILTGFGSEEIAVQSIYEGAIDYLPKDHLTRDKLLGTVKVAVERWKRKRAEADRERFLKELERKNFELQKAMEHMANLEEVTRMKNAELEETNIKLDRSNKELHNFVYIASHDLREPLRKVSAFGRMLQESLKGKLDEDEEENFAFMIEGATRMQQMINDLLLYSRVTTKANPPERVDLNAVIEELKNVELAVRLEENGGTINVPEPLPPVLADPTQIHQLLQNLIGNGLKYSRKGVAPVITVRSQMLDANIVRIEVQDNGIGIEEKYYANIFGMFKRLHSREDYEGSGIGLAVCKKIVERHGGEIGVVSKPGVGSTFWFTISITEFPLQKKMGNHG
jgi:signal transduction histidine kinase